MRKELDEKRMNRNKGKEEEDGERGRKGSTCRERERVPHMGGQSNNIQGQGTYTCI